MATTAEERARWRERMARLAVAEEFGDPTVEDRERAVGEADRWRAAVDLAVHRSLRRRG